MRVKLMITIMAVALLCCGCGPKYECSRCNVKMSEAYYDPFSEGDYFCESCARDYFSPFPYSNFKVD